MDAVAAVHKGQLSDGVARLKREFHESPPHLSGQRLRFLLDTYKEYAAESAPIVRARLLEKILGNMTLFIDDNPIVGSTTEHRKGAIAYPEWTCLWSKEEARAPSGAHSGTHTDELPVTDADLPLMEEAVAFWKTKCTDARTEELFKQRYPDVPGSAQLNRHGVWIVLGQPIVQTVVNWKKVLTIGLAGIVREAEENLAGLPVGDNQSYDKREFLQAAIISLKATVAFARRYAALARELAETEQDRRRKAELEKIADTCERVPEHPPRTFHEALQSWWLVYVVNWIESSTGAAMGRITDDFYPFYAQDKADGRITPEQAIELLHYLLLKISEGGKAIYVGRRSLNYGAQNLGAQTGIGGVDARGGDATNELDFLLVEAQRRIQLPEITLGLLYHDKLSEEFLVKCIDLIRTGVGQPPFYNNDIFLQRALFDYPGIPLADARNVAPIGCLQMGLCGPMFYAGLGFLNSAKMLELALNDGKDALAGTQLGPRTGDARAFKSYQELHDAVRKQFQHFVPLWLERGRIHFDYMGKITPLTFQSALVDGCLENGRDIYNGGAKYNQAGGCFVATIDLANSLAAIKKLVFDERKITLGALIDALQADFEGEANARIRRMCVDAPKFGNDDPYVDSIARDWYDILYEEHQNASQPYPRPDSAIVPQAYSNTMHWGLGFHTGARASGVKARTALTDATVSATPGTDVNGPTALAKSAAAAIDCVKYGSNHLNMKFHPSVLEGAGGARKLLALIKSYMDLGGHHVQFNCISGETLKAAQLHPEEHRDLVVRVAGFSAYFVQLPQGVQDEIIRRTELSF